jgi:hypothetical protein
VIDNYDDVTHALVPGVGSPVENVGTRYGLSRTDDRAEPTLSVRPEEPHAQAEVLDALGVENADRQGSGAKLDAALNRCCWLSNLIMVSEEWELGAGNTIPLAKRPC